MELYLIRHGESAGNAGLDPSPDPVLTPLGRLQAASVGECLQGLGITHLYASAMRRGAETAHLIGGILGLKPELWPELVEVADWRTPQGVHTGTPRAQLARHYPGATFRPGFPERDWWSIPVEDEPRAYQRARWVEAELRRRHEATGDRVAAVSHGTFGALLIGTLLGLPPGGYIRFSQRNCCISLIELLPGRSKLRFLNRVEHLPGPEGRPLVTRLLPP